MNDDNAARALQRTAAPLGSRTARIIRQRLLRPAGRFRRRSLRFELDPKDWTTKRGN